MFHRISLTLVLCLSGTITTSGTADEPPQPLPAKTALPAAGPRLSASIIRITGDDVKMLASQFQKTPANAGETAVLHFSRDDMEHPWFRRVPVDRWGGREWWLSEEEVSVRAVSPRKPGESRWDVKPVVADMTVEILDLQPDVLKCLISGSVSAPVESKVSASIELNRSGAALLTIPCGDGSHLGYCLRMSDASDLASTREATLALSAVNEQAAPPRLQYLIESKIVEMQDGPFEVLEEALSLQHEGSGRMVKMSPNDAQKFSEFCLQHQKAGTLRTVSRPSMVTSEGQPATIHVGGEVPFLPSSLAGTGAPKFKSVGLNLEVRIRSTGTDQHFVEWELTNSEMVPVSGGNAVRARHGLDGAATIGSDDVILVASRALSGEEKVWLVTLLHAKVIERIAAPTPPTLGRLVDETLSAPAASKFRRNPLSGTGSPLDSPLAGTTTNPDGAVRVSPGKTFRLTRKSGTIRATEQDSWQVQCPGRLKAIQDFDDTKIHVSTVDGDPTSIVVKMLRQGTTAVGLVYEDGTEQVVSIEIGPRDGGLAALLRRLYPKHDLRTFRIKNAILLRGRVHDLQEQREVISIAEQFFPRVLNQLTISDRTQEKRSIDNTRSIRESRNSDVVRLPERTDPLILVDGTTATVQCPEKIVCVSGFDQELLTVSSVAGFPTTLKISLAEVPQRKYGGTRLVVTGQESTYVLDVVTEESVAELASVVEQLYPSSDLVFIPVNGTVIASGTVEHQAHIDQVITIAEQCYLNVLSHLSTIDDPAAPKPALFEDPTARRPAVHQSATARTAGLRSRQSVLEMESIRSDIKALHSDVRQLIELLQAERKAPPRSEFSGEGDLPAAPLTAQPPVSVIPAEDAQSIPGRGALLGSRMLYFEAAYCRPCQQMDGILRAATAKSVDTSSLRRVDITKEPELTREFRIDRIPTLIHLKDGQEVLRLTGAISEERMLRLLSQKADPTLQDDSPSQVNEGASLIPPARPEDDSAAARREGL